MMLRIFLINLLLMVPVLADGLKANVGTFLPLSGSDVGLGIEVKRGIELAVQNIGNTFPQVELVFEDTEGSVPVIKEEVRALLDRYTLCCVIAPPSNRGTLVVADATERARMPLITYAMEDRLTQGRPFVFRITFTASEEGKALGHFARKGLQAKTAVVFEDPSSPYVSEVVKAFNDAFLTRGGKIVKRIIYSAQTSSFKTELEEIRALHADLIFFPGSAKEALGIIKESRELEVSAAFLGGTRLDLPPIRDYLPSASQKIYFASQFFPDQKNPEVAAFLQAFFAKYGLEPTALSALGYDAVMLVRDAVQRAASIEPKRVMQALADTKNFPGVTGHLTMQRDRNVSVPVSIVHLTHSGPVYVARILP